MATDRYKVLKGIDYPPGKRAEPGQTKDDLPPDQIRNLLRIGAIEKAKPTPKQPKAKGGEK